MLYDKDIREPLFDFLEETFGRIRIIEEKNMGSSRADVVMVTEHALVGIEIKSDADTYARLEGQCRDYDRFFDFNIIAVGTRHAMHIEEHVPAWWGIITVDEIDGRPDFYLFRQMKENPNLEKRNQLSLLWREELAHIQQINGMHAYKQKSKQFVRDRIFDTVPQPLLTDQICEELFQRDYTEIGERINIYRQKQHRPVRKRKRRKRITFS